MFLIYEEQPLPFVMTVAAGLLMALGLGWYRCRRGGASRSRAVLAMVLTPLLGFVFAHLGYCLARWEYVLTDKSAGYWFAFWEKGYMLYGGMAGCLLALLAIGGKRGFAKLADAFAPSGALMIAAARIAEGFAGQGYGEYVEAESALCRFPLMMYDAEMELWAWAIVSLEAVLALALMVALLVKRPTRPGDGALLLVGLYAAAQIVLESLRRDDFLRWGFVRCAELISAIALAAVLLCYCVRAPKGRLVSKALCWSLYAGMIGLCLLLEFAVDGKVSFFGLDENGCYVCMAAACAALAGAVLWMRSLGGAALAQGKDVPV